MDPNKKARPRPVDFHAEISDHECALLGAMGFSTAYIMAKTKLSQCQVTYRLAKAGLTKENGASRMDFRNGVSPFATAMLQSARKFVDRDLNAFLQNHVTM